MYKFRQRELIPLGDLFRLSIAGKKRVNRPSPKLITSSPLGHEDDLLRLPLKSSNGFTAVFAIPEAKSNPLEATFDPASKTSLTKGDLLLFLIAEKKKNFKFSGFQFCIKKIVKSHYLNKDGNGIRNNRIRMNFQRVPMSAKEFRVQ